MTDEVKQGEGENMEDVRSDQDSIANDQTRQPPHAAPEPGAGEPAGDSTTDQGYAPEQAAADDGE